MTDLLFGGQCGAASGPGGRRRGQASGRLSWGRPPCPHWQQRWQWLGGRVVGAGCNGGTGMTSCWSWLLVAQHHGGTAGTVLFLASFFNIITVNNFS